MAKFSAMQIANAVASEVSKAQNKKSKPKMPKPVEEPSLNEGKSGSSMAHPDDQVHTEQATSKPIPARKKDTSKPYSSGKK